MRVQVTQQHILEGIPSDPFCCPVARALRDSIVNHPHDYVSVFPGSVSDVRLYHKGWLVERFNLPAQVRNNIESFDAIREFQPCKFEIPDDIVKEWEG